ncbi:hypothetical protein AB0L74_28895 [Streptomyces sp. NPDC052020]|uniref:hypothetical protein n=1 Tax=Streptomyces sp. NPDC052020 TaxID=3155677 RepID=UPI00341F7A67
MPSPRFTPPAAPRRPGPVLASLVAAALAVAVLVVWAVQDRAAPPARGSTLQPARLRPPAAELRSRLPFDPLLRTPAETARRVHEAEQRLITACMARHGFRYQAAPSTRAGTAGGGPGQFGIDTLTPRSAAEPPGAQPSERPRGKAFTRALYGDPKQKISARNKAISVQGSATGCVAEAQTRLLGAGGPQRELTLRVRLDQGERDALQALARDSAYRRATDRWRACVRQAGITAKDPRHLAAGLRPDKPLAAQPAARADLACKQTTGYLRQAYGRLAVMQQRWLEAHRETETAWKALRKRKADAAARVLDRP